MGLAALFAGCSTGNSAQQPQSDPEPQQNDSEQPPAAEEPSQPSQGEGTQQEGDGEQDDEEEQAAASAWTWNDVIVAEQEAKQFNAEQLDNVHERALQGEEIEESYSIDFSKNRHNYSHGGHTWDLQHFQSHNTDTYEGFLDAVSDAITLGVHHIQQNENEGFPSSWRTEIGSTAELLLEQAHDLEDTHIWGWGNDGHGFNYILSEDHGVSLIDTTTNHAGRAGTNPLQNAPYGNDIVSKFDESWVDPDSDIPGFKANTIQNFLTNGVYEGTDANESAVGYQLDHIPDLVDKYKAEDSGEFLWNKHRPAVATTVNRLARDIEEEEKLIMINPDNIENLPDIRNYEDFQEYRSELKQYTEVMDYEDEDGDIYL